MAGKKTDVDKSADKELGNKTTQKKPIQSRTGNTPAFNSVIPPKTDKKQKPTPNVHPAKAYKGISRASAVFLALVATLAGGAIGWLGPAMFKNTGVTDTLTQTVQTLQSDLKSETAKTAALAVALKAAQQSNSIQTQQIQSDILEQKQHLKSLSELNNTTEIEQLKSRLDAQDAVMGLETKEGEISVGAQALLERLTALETQITDLQAKPQTQTTPSKSPSSEFPLPNAEPIKLPQTEPQANLSTQERGEILTILIDSFPRTDMLAAVNAQNKIAAKKPSWLQKTLSKHVKVRDDNTPALATINAAETALKSGKIGEALAQIKKLNPPVRAIAKQWVIAATKAQKTLSSTTNSEER